MATTLPEIIAGPIGRSRNPANTAADILSAGFFASTAAVVLASSVFGFLGFFCAAILNIGTHSRNAISRTYVRVAFMTSLLMEANWEERMYTLSARESETGISLPNCGGIAQAKMVVADAFERKGARSGIRRSVRVRTKASPGFKRD